MAHFHRYALQRGLHYRESVQQLEQPFLMSWGLIPWSLLSHKQMTYRELLSQLLDLDDAHLNQTVTLYSIADDEVVPMYQTDFTDSEDQVIPDHFVLTF